MKVYITGEGTIGQIEAEIDNPRHPSREFVRQAKIRLGAQKIRIHPEDPALYEQVRGVIWRG